MDQEIILRLISESIKDAKKGTYTDRTIFKKALKFFPLKQILSIVGVRRCWKSTLMKELVRVALKITSKNNILYLNLEQPFFKQFKEDVQNLQKIYKLFLENADKRKKIFVFLDEIQFFNDWQIFIKWLYFFYI